MSETRKTALMARFDQAERYDAYAPIQQDCAALVADRIARNLVEAAPPTTILEIGCGTGFLSAHLARLFPQAALCLTDLAPAMLDRTARRLAAPVHTPAECPARAEGPRLFLAMDGERPLTRFPPPFENASFDLIASSLCVQWFGNRKDAFGRLCAPLRPGGLFVAATLLEGSLDEWRESCASVGTPCGVPEWPSLERLEKEWPSGGVGSWEETTLYEHRASARAFLDGLRAIGASLPRAGHRATTAGALRRAMAHFDRQADRENGAGRKRVTYRIGLGVFRKDPFPINKPD